MLGRPPLLWLDIAVKASLIGLLLFAVLRQDLPQFARKAMEGRALTYPIAALIVPSAGGWFGAAGEPTTRTPSTSSSSFRS